MSLEEPEILVEVAGNRGEKVGGDFVVEVFALVDGLPQGVGMVRDVVHQPLELRGAVGCGEVGFLQCGLRGDFAGRAISDAPKGSDALSDGIRLTLDMFRDRIKQFVKGNKMSALEVPMGPFDLGEKIDSIGETRVEKRGDRLPV